MQKLAAANLYRSELIPISGKLVERYNLCLRKMGFKETALTSFSIDGIGWSPEIAEEKKSVHYLNSGEANPHGILISPLQKGKPVYVPFHSFDRDMMKVIFNTYEDKIRNITRDSAICIAFDQHIDTFYEPLDVLKYKNVNISFHYINDLKKIQTQQEELVEEFMQGNNFINEDLHTKILNSAKAHGDLRGRDIGMAPLVYESSSFYTKAFKGVYVLRDFILPMVVFEDEQSYKEAIKDTVHDVLIYHIDQPELMDKLRDHLLIECELDKVVKTDRYTRVKKFFLSNYLKDTDHPLNEILSESLLFKKYLNQIAIGDRKKVMGAELYLEKLEVSNQYKIEDIVDMSMYNALHKPHSSLEVKYQDLIWKLLVNVSAQDILHLYWYDKEQFYESFGTWNDGIKEWVIETILNKIKTTKQ